MFLAIDWTTKLSAYAYDAIEILNCVVDNLIAIIADFFLYKGVLKNAKNPSSVLKRLAYSIGSRTAAYFGAYFAIIVLSLIIAIEMTKCITYIIAINVLNRTQEKHV